MAVSCAQVEELGQCQGLGVEAGYSACWGREEPGSWEILAWHLQSRKPAEA